MRYILYNIILCPRARLFVAGGCTGGHNFKGSGTDGDELRDVHVRSIYISIMFYTPAHPPTPKHPQPRAWGRAHARARTDTHTDPTIVFVLIYIYIVCYIYIYIYIYII